MDARYIIVFVADKTPAFRQVLDQAFDVGLTTNSEGGRDLVERYEADYKRSTDVPLDNTLEELSQADRASLYLWAPSNMELRLSTSEVSGVDVGEWHGRADIGFQTTEIDAKHRDQSTIDENIDILYSLVKALTRTVQPEFVWSAIVDDNDEWKQRKPDGRPIKNHIDDLSWITVLSKSNIGQFGGREHVLETPAHKIDELETGHIVLMLEDHPYNPSETSGQSWKRHLLRD